MFAFPTPVTALFLPDWAMGLALAYGHGLYQTIPEVSTALGVTGLEIGMGTILTDEIQYTECLLMGFWERFSCSEKEKAPLFCRMWSPLYLMPRRVAAVLWQVGELTH